MIKIGVKTHLTLHRVRPDWKEIRMELWRGNRRQLLGRKKTVNELRKENKPYSYKQPACHMLKYVNFLSELRIFSSHLEQSQKFYSLKLITR